jgi:hypothetical protein
MNISLRAKSEINYLQNSSQLDCLRKCFLCVFESHDQHHMTCFIKREFACLNKHDIFY